MALYGGIELHANNSLIALLDAHDQMVAEKRLPNDLNTILDYLAPYHTELTGRVVESTYNWYRLVDGLRDAGYRVHLAHTAAIQQYEGLKFSHDQVDARWLAHLLRLDILPEGYISPKDERAVRDLLRKRAQLVRQKVTQMLSIPSQFARHSGHAPGANRIRQLGEHDLERQFADAHVALAVTSNLRMLRCLASPIQCLERAVLRHMRSKPEMHWLKTVPGIGDILALTILLETGTIARFTSVGDFASYGRGVKSQRLSHGKVKGQGHTKNGHKYQCRERTWGTPEILRAESLMSFLTIREDAGGLRRVLLQVLILRAVGRSIDDLDAHGRSPLHHRPPGRGTAAGGPPLPGGSCLSRGAGTL